MTITVRSVDVIVPEITSLFRAANALHRNLYPAYADRFTDEAIEGVKLDFLCAAFKEETIVGVGGIIVHEEYAEAVKIYVHEDHRRKGISSKIMQFLEEWTINQGIRIMKLFTGIKQTAAIALYCKLGYEEISCYLGWPPEHTGMSKFFQKELIKTSKG